MFVVVVVIVAVSVVVVVIAGVVRVVVDIVAVVVVAVVVVVFTPVSCRAQVCFQNKARKSQRKQKKPRVCFELSPQPCSWIINNALSVFFSVKS